MTNRTKDINAFFKQGNNPQDSIRFVQESAGFFMPKILKVADKIKGALRRMNSGATRATFYHIKVFVIAFSLIALYQPIGKDSKSELFTGSNNEYFTQNRFKKVGAMFFTSTTPDLQEVLRLQI